jgi:hypothetical protein
MDIDTPGTNPPHDAELPRNTVENQRILVNNAISLPGSRPTDSA